MFNANDLLAELKKSGLSGQSFDRISHAFNQGGLGGLGAQLQDMFGGASGGGGMGGLADRAKDMFGRARGAVSGGDPIAIGGLGALVGTLLGGGGGAIRGALGGTVMSVLGMLAYNALKGGSGDPQAAVPPGEEVPLGLRPPATEGEQQALESRALLALKAMISAAKADGEIDAGEREKIVAKLDESGADPEIREAIAREMAAPIDLEALVRQVPDQRAAAQIYAASLLAITVDTKAERDYLRRLAAALGMESQVVANLHEVLGAPSVA